MSDIMVEVTDLREEGGGGGISSSRKWSLLDGYLLESICQHLSFRDFLRVRAVCSNWRAEIKAMLHLPSFKVLLLLYANHLHRKFTFFNLSTSTRDRLFNLKWPTFLGSRSGDRSEPLIDCNRNRILCHGAVQGWMIMTEFNLSSFQTHVFFYNPITHTIFKLPSSLPQANTPTRKIFKIVASSPHTDPNCVLVCLYTDRYNFAFRKINNNSWTLVKGDKDSGINFMEVEIHKGKLYAITDDKLNSLLVYDLQQQQPKPIILAKLPYNDITHRNKFQHLAVDASREELFLVRHNMETSGDRIVVKCQVSKLRMVDDKWTQVDDLGDRLLFVGEYKSLVVSSQSGFDLHGHRRFHPPMSYNCVCFGSSGFGKYLARGKEGMMRFSFDVYCLTDQSMTIHNLLFTNICDFEDKSPPPPIWFTPSV